MTKKYNPDTQHRRSVRLKGYDYSQQGAYFFTICTQNLECLFGEIKDENMIPNDAGKMLWNIWKEIPQFYQEVEIYEFIVMPNHVHGTVILKSPMDTRSGQPQGVAPTRLSLPDIISRFKSFTTTKYIKAVKTNSWQPFDRKLWQRNYFERIIRNDVELNNIRKYIINNPAKWENDEEHPNRHM